MTDRQVRTDIRSKTGSAGELFAGSTVEVARRLIGATLHRRLPKGEPDAGLWLTGRVVETEAYLPLVDPSCHGYRGPTRRNASLFGRSGFAYVYLIYGMYFCFNVTTEAPGIGAAVLIRALEPIQGIAAMQRRRGPAIAVDALASGPGNLCKAFAIDLRCDGLDLRSGDLFIDRREPLPDERIGVSARIGLGVAEKWPLRFYDLESPSVSPYRKTRNGRSIKSRSRR
jgi:DNA-3-methyladenine glycosylase